MTPPIWLRSSRTLASRFISALILITARFYVSRDSLLTHFPRPKLPFSFYSGHGLQVRGNNYLVPIDAELQHEIDVDAQTVKLDLLLEQMERHAKATIVFLDACRDNPLARTLARSMGLTRAGDINRGLAPVRASTFGTFISFATAPNNLALDGDGRNSPFTTALKKHIVEAGKDLGAIMINVRNDVIMATKEKQVPWENTALRAQFFFKAAVAPPPQEKLPAPDALAEAAKVWSEIKNTTSMAMLESFARRFDGTIYADMARARTTELAARSVAPSPGPLGDARDDFLKSPKRRNSPSLAQYVLTDSPSYAPGATIKIKIGASSRYVKAFAVFPFGAGGSTKSEAVYSIPDGGLVIRQKVPLTTKSGTYDVRVFVQEIQTKAEEQRSLPVDIN